MSGQTLQQWAWLGGHGVFVWGALVLCLGAVLIEWIALRHARQRALRRIMRLHRGKQESWKNDRKTN
jgi:heme exporter protein CcmD